ncbi:group II truncated hemoglobin [Neisseria animalis]|uniref:Globin n=1 Tax=Neisseria animalis TaxID=492 RepID=A0A5P3MQ67_NEIAN|nr:group II truncated hemoglobin [Neisseria animalis]QEY23713.1 globin [Neisseria animalis]ROW32855.1 globin [Neisseria animalis]VEE09540.1 Truncated hemoglobin [Neisseria animalis]
MTTLYNLLGADKGVDEIVTRFYDLMDLEPQYAELRQTHGETLDYARDRLFKFLSGWLGGPPLYEEAHGHPRLRQRHMPFEVDMQTRNQWIACFAQALRELAVQTDYAEAVLIRLFALGDWMRNRHEPDYPPPQPPMAGKPEARIPELKAVLAEYGIEGFFE